MALSSIGAVIVGVRQSRSLSTVTAIADTWQLATVFMIITTVKLRSSIIRVNGYFFD